MSRRSWLLMALLLPGLGAPPLALASREESRRPNVLLISLDTVRADYLTFRDPETARNMTGLARHGTVFTQAISGTSWTLPAHAQLFTGMAPPYHGVESGDVGVDPLIPFLPEVVRGLGYYTAGFFTVRYLWGDYGFARGYDFYRSAQVKENLFEEDGRLAPRGREAEERTKLIESRDYVTSPNVVVLARRALERARPETPVFFFAHFFDPHEDYVPPPPWDTRFDPDYEGDIDGRDYQNNRRIWDPEKKPIRRIGDRDLEHIKALYRGEIAWTDQWVGELLDLFEEHRRLDDTLVVITADHGEEFFDHGKISHRTTLYDEVLRVPLLIVPPRRLRDGLASQVDAQVSLSDIMPTVLDFLGEEPPDTVTGRSLRPAMYGKDFDSRPELISLYLTMRTKYGGRDHIQAYGLRTPDYKFLRSVKLQSDQSATTSAVYYDLVEDPEELAPISDPDDPRVQRGWDDLERVLDDARSQWRRRAHTSRDDLTTDLTEDSIEELRALGYLDVEEVPGEATIKRPWGLAPMARIDREPSPAWKGPAAVGLAVAALAAVLLGRIRRRTRARAS